MLVSRPAGRSLLLVLLFAAVMLGTARAVRASMAAAVDLYVSSTGNDSTGDGTAAKPLATLAKAAAQAGDQIVIHLTAGTFNATDLVLPPSPNRLTILGTRGAGP